jgi:hypothetical protein
MASPYNAPLVPDASMGYPAVYFGIPKRKEWGELPECKYSITKELDEYRDISENYFDGLAESDFLRYILESEKIMSIGDLVTFQGRKLNIKSVTRTIKKSLLHNQYIISNEKGMKQKTIYNEKISGMSINGTVIDRKNDLVKIWFDIDPVQDREKACSFFFSTSYTSGGNAGFYCMPELYEKVRVYFPTDKEAEALAQSSVRKPFEESKNRGDPDIKYLRTKAGKELRLYPGGILLSAEDGKTFMDLKDLSHGEGSGETVAIKIMSLDHDIKFMTRKNIVFEAGESIGVSAGEKIVIAIDPEAAADVDKPYEDTPQSTYIRLDGSSGTVRINAKEVKTQN